MENNNQEQKDGLVKKAGKQAVNEGKNKIKKTIFKKVIIPYVLPFLGIVLLVAIGIGLIAGVIQSIMNFFSGSDIFSYTDENGNTIESIYIVEHANGTYEFEIDDNYKQAIKDYLKKETGYDTDSIYLSDNLLEKMIKAEATTSLPKIGDSGFQGDVVVSRYDATIETEDEEPTEEEEEEAQMIYLSPNDFLAKYKEALEIAKGLDSSIDGVYSNAASKTSEIEGSHLEDIQEARKKEQTDIESKLKSYDCYYTLGKLSTNDARRDKY